MVTALIVVDVQNDFCEGGAMGVEGGSAVAHGVAELVATSPYAVTVATADHHVEPHGHFAEQPDFVTTWPPHCVADTPGAAFHPALDAVEFDAVFLKGRYEAAYSGFEGLSRGVELDDWLRSRDVDAVHIVGLATDHCVLATALDAARLGFATTVHLDLVAGVAPDTTAAALERMHAAGIALCTSSRT
jgi:nicotinamidase/pyrazinamidase